jgi:2-iminobutanoate/2-iminopropanoate deaminase
MKVETFTPANVMKPIGPYSHMAKAGSFIAISGTAGVDPATGEFAGPDAYSQARQVVSPNHLPARTVVVVADLPKKDALLTMNLTAVTKD